MPQTWLPSSFLSREAENPSLHRVCLGNWMECRGFKNFSASNPPNLSSDKRSLRSEQISQKLVKCFDITFKKSTKQ